jgi:hypothetical protein
VFPLASVIGVYASVPVRVFPLELSTYVIELLGSGPFPDVSTIDVSVTGVLGATETEFGVVTISGAGYFTEILDGADVDEE